MTKVTYVFVYYARGAYRTKRIEVEKQATLAETTRLAIKRSRLNESIVDITIEN